jgi:farnesyl-diphosphate farnesyltransferase
MAESFQELLQATSRSFYLTLRVLPAAVRPQIGLTYLLARTTDTIADTEILPVEQRLAALQKLRERILGQSSAPLNFSDLARQQGLPAEKTLLEKTEDSLGLLQTLTAEDLKLVREVLVTITSGQELDLRRFESLGSTESRPTRQKIIALRTDEELDDYTYRVAGCVGEFWTKMCRAHLFPQAKIDDAQLLADGIRFGKGLQLVNVLRDLPVDLQKGRCYLPATKLTEAGLMPADLLQPANATKFRPIYNSYLDFAESHLAAGWNYTNTIPWTHIRVRLACAWPILIGAKTIERLRAGNVLDPQQRIKVSRPEVKKIMMRSIISYAWQPRWRRQFTRSSGAS